MLHRRENPTSGQTTNSASERFRAEGRPFKTQTVHKAGLGKIGILRKTKRRGTERTAF